MMVNSETDLKIFIDEHRTYEEFKPRIEFKNYDPSRSGDDDAFEMIGSTFN